MKILHVIPTLQSGGAESILSTVAAEQVRMGHDVEVLAMRSGTLAQKLRADGVRVRVATPGRHARLARWADAARFLWVLRSGRSDVTVAWMYHCTALVGLLRAGPKLMSVHHAAPNDEGLRWRTRRFANACAKLSSRFACAIYVHESQEAAHRRSGFSLPAVIAPGGADNRRFVRSTATQRRETRESLGVPSNARVVAHVARFHPDKDQETLLRAFELTQREINDAHLVLIGRGLDNGNETLTRWTRELSIDSCVTLLGEVASPEIVLGAADVYCLSSLTEALPVSLLEAMLSGLVPAVTDVGACAAVVGEVGQVAPPGDPVALSRALIQALDLAKLPESRSHAQRAAAPFSADRTANLYMGAIESAVKGVIAPREA